MHKILCIDRKNNRINQLRSWFLYVLLDFKSSYLGGGKLSILVESRMDAVRQKCCPFPIPAHRTGRADFPHPALRQDSSPDSRIIIKVYGAQMYYSQQTPNHLARQGVNTTRMQFLPLSQKTTNTPSNVIINRSVCLKPGAMAEVVRPTAKNAVQPISDFWPGILVSRYQNFVNFPPQARHTFSRRAGSHIPMTIFPIAVRPKRISKKVKAFPPSISKFRLGLVQGQSQTAHHFPRPIPCLHRMMMCKNHEIVSISDYMGLESCSPFSDPPILQKSIQVEIGKHWAGNPTLRGSTAALPSPSYSSIPLFVPLFDRSFQPRLDKTQYFPIDNSPGHTLHKFPVWDRIKVFRQIGINDIRIPLVEKHVHSLDGVARASLRSITIGTRFQIRFENRLQHHLGSRLNHSIPNSWNAKRPLASSRLRYHYALHRLRLVPFSAKFLPEPSQPLLQSLRLNLLKGLPIYSRRASIGFCQFISLGQYILAVNLVVKQVETVFRFILRLAIQLPLKCPDLNRCLQAHRQSPHLRIFKSTPEVRALPSTGITRLQQYYDPLRDPTEPSSLSERWSSFLHPAGGSLTRPDHLPGMPCSLPRWTQTGAFVGCFPAGNVFPVMQAGRHPQLHFRGLLKLHSRYGLQGCSATQGGLCHKASTQPVTKLSCLSAIRLTDYYLSGTFTRWRSALLRRTA